VPGPSGDDSLAMLQAQEDLARSTIITASEEARLETVQQSSPAQGNGKAAPAKNADADLYLGLIAGASGIEEITSVMGFIGERRTAGTNNTTPARRTIDDDIGQSVSRKPGLYADPKGWDTAADTKTKTGQNLCERANIAQMSLRDQGPRAIQSWGIPPVQMGGVAQAKSLVFDRQMVSEQTIGLIQLERERTVAMQADLGRMVPGLGMGAGPAMRPSDMAKIAKEQAERDDALNRWRSGRDTWSGGETTA